MASRTSRLTTLGAQAAADIGSIIANPGAGTLQALAHQPAPNQFGVYYDISKHRIEVQDLTVNGGFVSLTGHVLNTQNGTIEVLGGYGTIDIENNTNYDIEINRIDASSPGRGKLVINDFNTSPSNPNAPTTFSVYQMNAATGTVALSTETGNGPVVPSTVAANSPYQPASNWRYGWTIGLAETEIKTKQVTSSNWIGIIPTGSGFSDWDSIVPAGLPTLDTAGQGPYYYHVDTNPQGSAFNYEFNQSTMVLSVGALETIGHTEISTWYGGHTYSATYQQIDGVEVLYKHDINASRPIAVDFTGGTSGSVTVHSSGTGNIYLNSQILNPTGATKVQADHGSILSSAPGIAPGAQGSTTQVLTGKSIDLEAPQGAIGTKTSALQINSFGNGGLVAHAKNDISITEIAGDMAVDTVVSSSQGNVALTALDGAISVASSHAVQVSGGVITLNAGGGGIGNGTVTPLTLDTPNPVGGLVDRLTANAKADVYSKEFSGDLRLNSLNTTGAVWISVPNGSLLNASTDSTIDTRTQSQLEAGVWSQLSLTDSTGYRGKVKRDSELVGSPECRLRDLLVVPAHAAGWRRGLRCRLHGWVVGGRAGLLQERSELQSKRHQHAGDFAYHGIPRAERAIRCGRHVHGAGSELQPERVSRHGLGHVGAGRIFRRQHGDGTGVFSSGATDDSAVLPQQLRSAKPRRQRSSSRGTRRNPGFMTRTDAGSFITDGYAAGQKVQIGGSAGNGGVTLTISNVTATVLTFSAADTIVNEKTNLTAESVSIASKLAVYFPAITA